MLLELILSLIKSLFLFIFSAVPVLGNIVFPDGFVPWFANIVSNTAYFLPIVDLFMMFSLWIVITNFHIMYKAIMRAWDALPFT